MESIVFDPNIPFKLGGHALKMLLERFSFHDLSVRHFLMGVKVCIVGIVNLQIVCTILIQYFKTFTALEFLK